MNDFFACGQTEGIDPKGQDDEANDVGGGGGIREAHAADAQGRVSCADGNADAVGRVLCAG